ncbi:MAG: ABC transporter substrate-binding protein, partial [Ancrocorticia populi]|uniref:ABC transporter substrate-binding protein n=1 Tax=Ancrocorticia populi TaxID=2175228 RepID=UPI003F8E7715
MRNRKSRLGAVAAVASTVCLTLAACGGGDSDATDGSDNGDSAAIAQEAWESEAPVTISVSDLPPTSKPEIREARLALIEDFEDKYPYITVEPEEVTWAADTFPTMLASDTVPTVMNLPFTEMQPMIQREQAADVTDYVALDEALGESNESLVELATGPDDRQYGVPMDAYTMGLYYNRSLFEEVGLDPDAPPQTWDEVRDAATKINDETDAQGFIFMTSDNTGGWVFTPIVNGFGGETVSEDGTTATLDDPAVKEALQFYHDVRWEDNSAGSNFLVAFDDANQLFGAGQAGMYIAPGNQFNNIV